MMILQDRIGLIDICATRATQLRSGGGRRLLITMMSTVMTGGG